MIEEEENVKVMQGIAWKFQGICCEDRAFPPTKGRETVPGALIDECHPGCGVGHLYFDRNRGVARYIALVLIVPDDCVEDERRHDDAEAGRGPGEGFLKGGRFHHSCGYYDCLAGNAHAITRHGADVDGKAKLELGGITVAAIMLIERPGQYAKKLVHSSCCRNVRRYHYQDPVTTVFQPCTGKALHGRLYHAVQRLPDDPTVGVGALMCAEADYIGEDDCAVLALQ